MKTQQWLVFFLLAWMSTHAACANRPILEARASYFSPFSKTFREVFSSGGVDFALETTVPVWRGLNIWGEVDYFSRRGKMIGIDRTAHITLVPITLGLKYLYPFNQYCAIYGGSGAKYYFVELVNRMYPIYRTTHRQGLGGAIELGGLICLFQHLVIDLFATWSFKSFNGLENLPPNAITTKIRVGGWNLGGGIGYKF